MYKSKIHYGEIVSIGGPLSKMAKPSEVLYYMRCNKTGRLHKVMEINIIDGKHVSDVSDLVNL